MGRRRGVDHRGCFRQWDGKDPFVRKGWGFSGGWRKGCPPIYGLQGSEGIHNLIVFKSLIIYLRLTSSSKIQYNWGTKWGIVSLMPTLPRRMLMPIHKLSPRKVATAGPGKYEDGGGLRLVVSPSEARKWVFRFTINGRRREMGLGSFPDVSLAEAREKAAKCRKLVKEGVDPIEARRKEQVKVPTFTRLCGPLHLGAS